MKTTTALKASSLRDKLDDSSNCKEVESLVDDVIEANFLEMKECYRMGMEVNKINSFILDLSDLPDGEVKGFMLMCRLEAVRRFADWINN